VIRLDADTVRRHAEVMRWQDEVLLAVQDGRPVPHQAIRALPPWRAALLADIAHAAGVPLERGNYKSLRRLAADVGGNAPAGWADCLPPNRTEAALKARREATS
jgi:hypothetical protein